jgi:signal transduction histidine kinase
VYRNSIVAISLAVIAIAVTASAGWLFNVKTLVSILPAYEVMKFNTMLLFLFSGGSLYTQAHQRHRFSKLLASLVLAGASLTLAQSLFQLNFKIDELFISDYFIANPNHPHPGRMAITTAISFMLFSFSMIIHTKASKEWKIAAQLSLYIILLISLITLTGYAANLPKLHQLTGLTSMAIPTAVLFILLGIGADLLNGDRSLTTVFLKANTGNTMAQKVFIPYTIILIALGIITFLLYRLEFINREYAIGLFSISLFFTGLIVVAYAANSINDIEEQRRQAEVKTLQQAEELQNMMTGITDGFFATDRQLKITLLNPVVADAIGVNAEQSIGRHLLEVLPFLQGSQLYEQLKHALQTSKAQTLEHQSILDSNTYYQMHVYPNPSGLFIFSRNITTVKQAENEINNLNQSLALANQQLEQKVELRTIELNRANKHLETLTTKLHEHNTKLKNYIHIISHNLRSHSVNLNYLVRYMKEADKPDTLKELTQKLDTVVKNLNETLDALVETVKIQDAENIEVEEINFETILKKTEIVLLNDIEKTQAKIQHNFNEVSTIYYPKVYMESIFLNMLSNALRYKSDERTPAISIKSFKIETAVYLTFTDNGQGMDLERYGHKLFGLNKTFHQHPEAKGVGLFMVKNQVEAMGGDILVNSVLGKGTTFTILLNIKQLTPKKIN